MKQNIKDINKEFFKKRKFIKNEIKMLILKSILSNKHTTPIKRSLALFMKSKMKNNRISKQKNICLKTGRYKGFYKNFGLSRHQVKHMFLNNQLQNVRVKNW